MKEEQVKRIFERLVNIAYKKTSDNVHPMDKKPEIELVHELYDVFNSKPKFDIYINTFNDDEGINQSINAAFNSYLRESARMVGLWNEMVYRIFYNTNIPEIFDELMSESEKLKTELENYLSGYDSKDSYFKVVFVGPENTNWIGMDAMSVRIIVELHTNDPNDDYLREAGIKTLEIVLNRMIKKYPMFEGYSPYLDIVEMDSDEHTEEISESKSKELSENKVKEFFTKHGTSIKKTFMEELKSSGDDAKSAYRNFTKMINSDEPISNEEREKIGNELKGVLRRTMMRLGMAGLFLLPGGTIFLILMKLFKRKKEKVEELPFDEVNEGTKKIRVFNEKTNSDEFKWNRDREDRLITILEGEGWKIQIDNELPKDLKNGQRFIIPEGVYHRVIKGNGNLKVSVEFI